VQYAYATSVEPITLAVVGTTVLVEGVKFLYAQAGEAIKYWRERRDTPVPIPADAPIEGELEPAKIDSAAMERLEGEIVELRQALDPYAADVAPALVDANNHDLIEVIEGLRRSLEAVLGQRIRFKGEAGEPSGPLVEGEVNVDDVLGYVAGVRARSIEGGVVRGSIRAKTVAPGSQAAGVDVDRIGGR
jgi:hypothetical protein